MKVFAIEAGINNAYLRPAVGSDTGSKGSQYFEGTPEAKKLREVGQFFKNHRLNLGLTQEEIAQGVGIDLALLQSYESGETFIALDDIFSLTNYLNIPPEEVFALVYDLSQDNQEVEQE